MSAYLHQELEDIDAITENSGAVGGVNDGDLPDLTATAAILTDSSGGSANQTVAAVAAPTNYAAHTSGPITVTSNSPMDLDTTTAGLALLENEVTALVATINNNFADVTDEINKLIADVADNTAAIREIATKVNTLRTALRDIGAMV